MGEKKKKRFVNKMGLSIRITFSAHIPQQPNSADAIIKQPNPVYQLQPRVLASQVLESIKQTSVPRTLCLDKP